VRPPLGSDTTSVARNTPRVNQKRHEDAAALGALVQGHGADLDGQEVAAALGAGTDRAGRSRLANGFRAAE
jgi:hypothetical protein